MICKTFRVLIINRLAPCYFLERKGGNNNQNRKSKAKLQVPRKILNTKANCNNRAKNRTNFKCMAELREQSVTVKAWSKRQMLKQNCKNRAESNTNFKYQAKLKNKAEKQVASKTSIAE